MTQAQYDAQVPCVECGARPGINPATGIAIDGASPHLWGCSLRT
jgi:hypothetical protein